MTTGIRRLDVSTLFTKQPLIQPPGVLSRRRYGILLRSPFFSPPDVKTFNKRNDRAGKVASRFIYGLRSRVQPRERVVSRAFKIIQRRTDCDVNAEDRYRTAISIRV